MRNLFLRFCLVAILATTGAAQAQQGSAVLTTAAAAHASAKTFQLDSKLIARQIPYAVVLPPNYESDKQARFPVVYLLHGLGGNYKNFAENAERLEYFAQHRFIVVCVEGGSGFYTDSATKPNDKYETYVINELIPEIDKNFRTIAERKGRAIAGMSMGGYGALKFGVKYPQLFALAAGWSAGITSASWRKASDLPTIPEIVQPLIATFGDGTDPAPLKANDLFLLFRNYPADKLADLPFFYVDCGTEDELGLLKPNQQLAALMLGRKIPHEFRELPGGHALQGYRIGDVFNLAERVFAAQKAAAAHP
jgi:S-formylglutathione hydrolase FrmB